MTECQSCNSKLVTAGLTPGQQVRCANCLTLFKFGKIEKVPTHRLAWRSFWLGLSSIVLLFITGLPAMYYGIRSLIRMRFVKPKPSDRAAAITGTALGGCFGIFIGFFAVCGMIVGLFAFLTYQETEQAMEVAQRCSEVFEVELPPGINPVRATSLFTTVDSFQFADSPKADQRRVLVQLKRQGMSLQENRSQLIRSFKRRRVNDHDLGETVSTELLNWEMDGQPVEVRKTIYSRPLYSDEEKKLMGEEAADEEERIETHQYFTYIFRPDGSYGLVVVFEPDGFDLAESEIRAIFSDTKIVDDPDTKIVDDPDTKTPADSR
jgi:hypothetical protein